MWQKKMNNSLSSGEKVWITKNGIVKREKKEGKVFSNEFFVLLLKEDDQVTSKLVQSMFPRPVQITLGKDIPDHWVCWDVADFDTLRNLALDVPVEEIPSSKRLFLPRRDIFSRKRKLMDSSGMIVTRRGVVSAGAPKTVEECCQHVVMCVYHLLENNSISSLKGDSIDNLSKDRQERLSSAVDIVKGEVPVRRAFLFSAYTEPTITAIKRFYYLSAIYGIEEMTKLIFDLYEKNCKKQKESIIQCWESVEDKFDL